MDCILGSIATFPDFVGLQMGSTTTVPLSQTIMQNLYPMGLHPSQTKCDQFEYGHWKSLLCQQIKLEYILT